MLRKPDNTAELKEIMHKEKEKVFEDNFDVTDLLQIQIIFIFIFSR